MITQRRIAAVIVVSVALISNRPLFSQTASPQANSSTSSGQNAQTSPDQDINLLRQDIRSQKKQMIASTMNLTDSEAEKFWPIYDQYTAELVKINNAKYDAIKQYAQNYGTLSDAQAVSLMQQVIGVDLSYLAFDQYIALNRSSV